jgi:hypothetical protein
VATCGQAALRAGLHGVELRYFHREFVAGLELRMDSPGRPPAPVGAERLFHREAPGQPR